MKYTFLDLLFPRRCPVCGEIVRPVGRLICPTCLPELSFVKSPVCKRCGKEVADDTMEFCAACMKHSHAFEACIALLNYNETARNAMVRIKYHNKREYMAFFGAAMAVRYENVIRRMNVDAIIPVPIHPARLRKRGFNQAELFARHLGDRLHIPVETKLLCRRKNTLPQKELSPAARLSNLSGAFAVTEQNERFRRVLLVDDIYTTGSTVEACAATLKSAGIQTVYVAVICMAGGERR